jgi:hypothetical protein
MSQPGTNKQVPDNSILDHFGKQVYLGNYFKFVLDYTSGDPGEGMGLYLSNPAVSASAFPSGYQSLFVDLRRFSVLTASANTTVRVYLNPTFTSGTSKTPINMRTGSGTVSIASLKSAPVVSVKGTLVEVLAGAQFTSVSSNGLIVLDPGKSLLVTVQMTSNGNVDLELGWYEL